MSKIIATIAIMCSIFLGLKLYQTRKDLLQLRALTDQLVDYATYMADHCDSK